MPSYKFLRRSFLAGLGGAFGLEILLQNMEASAQGVTPPPRLLVLHWPRGTMRHHYVPTGTGTSYVASRLLEPFEPVRSDTVALYGLSHTGIDDGGGSAHQAGMLRTMTGAASPGARDFGGGLIEACAGGPSWDQILLARVPALARRDANGALLGRGFVNAIADARTDSLEASGACLSYGYRTRSVASTSGATVNAHDGLIPELAPITLYNSLFQGAADVRALRMKKSVLDSGLRQLARLSELAPASERVKIDAHAQIIRQMEAEIAARVGSSEPGNPRCEVPPAPPRPMGSPAEQLAQTVRAHASILRAAFACDFIRVATLQLGVATHDAAVDGISDPGFFTGAPPAQGTPEYDAFENATALHAFYNGLAAEIVSSFRGQLDPLANGGNLLDRTVIPFVTEVSDESHALDRLPALVFGGRALGMQGGQFQSFESSPRSHNDFWVTLAQAFLGADPLTQLADEAFVKTGVAPIPGLWTAPS